MMWRQTLVLLVIFALLPLLNSNNIRGFLAGGVCSDEAFLYIILHPNASELKGLVHQGLVLKWMRSTSTLNKCVPDVPVRTVLWCCLACFG